MFLQFLEAITRPVMYDYDAVIIKVDNQTGWTT